jgi:hypothetical protein
MERGVVESEPEVLGGCQRCPCDSPSWCTDSSQACRHVVNFHSVQNVMSVVYTVTATPITYNCYANILKMGQPYLPPSLTTHII